MQGPIMADFTTARRMMVDGQIRTNDVTDPRIIAAFLAVPREMFVAGPKSGLAYLDIDVPAADSSGARCLLKPMVLAKLIQALDLGEAEHVLVVGSGSGYSAAILAHIAGSVVALEEDKALATQAGRLATELGLGNIEAVNGTLAAGWPDRAPFDAVLIDGGIEEMPQALTRQVREGGRIACVRREGGASKAVLYRCGAGEVSARPVFDASAPMLPGFLAKPAFVF